MLKTIFDFGEAKGFRSAKEDLFFKVLKDKYGFTAVETLFEQGPFENNLTVWILLSDNENKQSSTIQSIVKNNTLKRPLDIDIFPKETRVLAACLTAEYLEIFEIRDCKKTHLYINDFIYSVKSFAHGHSIKSIRELLNKRYGFEKRNILVFYEPQITIICENDELFQKASLNREQIHELCYLEIKKFDNYNILKLRDICVNIKNKSEISSALLNDYRMKQ